MARSRSLALLCSAFDGERDLPSWVVDLRKPAKADGQIYEYIAPSEDIVLGGAIGNFSRAPMRHDIRWLDASAETTFCLSSNRAGEVTLPGLVVDTISHVGKRGSFVDA